MKIPVVFFLLAAGLEAVSAENKYFEISGKLSLKPESVPNEGITSINWKHKGDFVAEWIKDSVPLSYFGAFKGRTDLDTITGELNIISMTKADEGIFSVEVNYKAQTADYSARGITHLRDTKVEALARPVACTFNSQHCNLSCQADVVDVGPVQYFWQQDEGQWKDSQKDININNDEETRLIKTFSCKIKNLISEKASEPLENPFSKKSDKQSNDGLVVGIIFLVLLILGGIGISLFAYKYPERVAPCLPCVAGKRHRPDDAENRVPMPELENIVTIPQNTEATFSNEENATAPGRTEADTVTSHGTPTPEHNESSVIVHQKTESNIETSNKTSPDPDESCEMTPLKGTETVTSNGTPSNT